MELQTPSTNGKNSSSDPNQSLERPQVRVPLLDLEAEEDEDAELETHVKSKDLRLRDKSLRRKTRSMSPLRNMPFEWIESEDGHEDISLGKEIKNGCSEIEENEREKIDGLGLETTPSVLASSSRSLARSSKRWLRANEREGDVDASECFSSISSQF